MQLNWMVERYGITRDVLNVINSLVDDEIYDKEDCARKLLHILRKHDLIDASILINELDKNKSTAEAKIG
ncbi:hypothetical protein J416_14837 [Gracilibacillus halophilus YIM-C55.5]|uniref:Uncharacterized protein n=1 Tax=Gracilibacillus halophilus YIM-C55.5 TaxID=1308866 RepID=N4WMD0_9BACI|nr:hypothetical protein [Gracilibacillus halophilus]ENH95670.1 hypothetical protein J416_14837 [Gracilibacillus halophilus YIM-C55.5]